MAVTSASRRAGILVRISDARDEDDDGEVDTSGVDRQERLCRQLADRRGSDVVAVYTENDTSAFKRRRIRLPDGSYGLRVVRPEFRRALTDIESGVINELIAYDLDRVARDPRDLEDLIDAVEQKKIPAVAVTGSLDLSTDAGITAARINVVVANKSSRDTSRRVRDKQLEMAEQGRPKGGGRRAYGYASDGITVIDAESEALKIMADLVLEGRSLVAIAEALNAKDIPPVKAEKWSARSVHSVVTKARNAGLRTYRGDVVGPATWPAILDVDTWEQLLVVLQGRAATHGNTLRWWLTGLLLCGLCSHTLRAWSGPHGKVYTCLSRLGGCGKISILCSKTEQVVEEILFEYLAQPENVDELMAATSTDNVRQARADAREDEAQLKELAEMWGKREITTPEYVTARREISDRLKRWKTVAQSSTPGPIRDLIEAEDMRAEWDGFDAHRKREAARVVFPHGIAVDPHVPKQQFGFDPARIRPIRSEDAGLQ